MTLSLFSSHISVMAGQCGISVEEAAKRCAGMGYAGIDHSRSGPLKDAGLEALKPFLSAGLYVNSVPMHWDAAHDPEPVDAVLEDIVRMGSKRLMIIPGNYLPDEDRDAVNERIAGRLRELVGAAAKAGITVGMEDFGTPTNPVFRASGLHYFMTNVPGLTCTLDTGNLILGGDGLLQSIGLLRPYITSHIHCKDHAVPTDASRKPSKTLGGLPVLSVAIGTGFLPLGLAVRTLAQTGFDGAYTVEIFGSPSMEADLRFSADFIRKASAV